MRRLTITTTAAFVLRLAGTAHAQTTITGGLTPNTTGAGSRVHDTTGAWVVRLTVRTAGVDSLRDVAVACVPAA